MNFDASFTQGRTEHVTPGLPPPVDVATKLRLTKGAPYPYTLGFSSSADGDDVRGFDMTWANNPSRDPAVTAAITCLAGGGNIDEITRHLPAGIDIHITETVKEIHRPHSDTPPLRPKNSAITQLAFLTEIETQISLADTHPHTPIAIRARILTYARTSYWIPAR
jgi:hypothetical protein